MKKALILSIFIFTCISYTYSQQSEVVAHFFSKPPIVLKEDGKSTATFGLTATAEQMDKISATANENLKKYSFESVLLDGKPYNYNCKMVFNNGEGLEAFHKTLLFFGVSSFYYSGQKYPLNEMLSIFK